MTDKDQIYVAGLPFIELRGNQAVFGGNPNEDDPAAMTWGEPDNRPVEPAEFVIDKRFWELLGCPDKVAVAVSTIEGWESKNYAQVD